MNQNKILSYISLAMKSGNVASGEFLTEKAVKEGNARLVVVAEDASANTKKMFANMCEYYHVPIVEYGSKDNLGHAMGKQFRASMAVLDDGFAKMIKENVNGGSMNGKNENL